MSGKTYYIDNNGTRHLIKKKIHIDANGVPTQIKKKFFDGKNTFSSSHIVKYHVDVDDVRDIEVDDGGDAILWAPIPVRSGWIFAGWREDDEANPAVLDHKTVEVDGLHLYAVFKKNITVTLQGGTDEITNTGTRYYNNSNDESPVITLGSSVMSGWNLVGYRNDMTATSSVDYTASQSYTFDESKTLYAVFNRTLTLSYNGNGATSGATAAQTGTQYYNNGYYQNPTIATRANGFARSNYRFDYWNIGSTSGTAVSAGGNVTLTNNTVLYAHWTLTYYVIVDSDYSTYNTNLWDIVTNLSIPANMTAYIQLTMNASSGLANAKYSMNEWDGSGWAGSRDFNGYNTMYPGQSSTLVLYYKNNVRVRIQNMMVGTGYVTNDNIHIKIWGQL